MSLQLFPLMSQSNTASIGAAMVRRRLAVRIAPIDHPDR
ncbi:hypothetical protein OEM_23870 [Mycobacterium intracellulare subsp. yongonense 05-1390]|nr:hypothetical protein OEM_23870 [Mycobacterium intracellulare subsp. yongonense 05-1390]